MLAGKPDAGNPHVRFDEGEQRDWRKPPVALYSTVIRGFQIRISGLIPVSGVQPRCKGNMAKIQPGARPRVPDLPCQARSEAGQRPWKPR
jgi:hypothetical protein